jgi:urea transporter
MKSISNQVDSFLQIIFRGIGQVMFQRSSTTGLFILVGIFIGAIISGTPLVAWGAVVGVTVSTITGYILNEKKADGRDGLWGFNGVLVGCAFPTFLANTWEMWLALILCSAATTWVRRAFNNVLSRWKINSLTFPFVFMTWIFLFSSIFIDRLHLFEQQHRLLIDYTFELDISLSSLFVYWLRGISQIFLINNWVTGLFFLIGLAVYNKWAAIWAAIGSALSLIIAITYTGNPMDISHGLFGFSPALTGIALGATFYRPGWRSAIWAVLGIIITVFIQGAMDAIMLPYGIPTLTAPFCLATWLFLLPLYKFDKKSEDVDHSEWTDLLQQIDDDVKTLEEELKKP